MYRLFKRKKIDAAAANPLQEKAAGWLVAKVLWVQSKWTIYMDRRVNSLSVRWKKFGLLVFVALSVLICISIQIESFTSSPPSAPLKIGHIHKLPLFNGKVYLPSFIPEQQYQRVMAFRHYMDSLAATDRRQFDSIQRSRPGLLDSARQLEKLYHQQNK